MKCVTKKTHAVLPYLAFALLVFGAKLCLIARAGNASPFWDQWGVEADGLYRPWLQGTLQWNSLFTPHNEHRLFTTRLMDLLMFELNNGIWDPFLQMVANAAIHVAALLLLVHFLKDLFRPSQQITLFVFAGIFFALPFGFDNTLTGFGVQFYFLQLFGFIFLWAIVRYAPFSLPWLLGLGSGVLCFLSLSAGALAPASAMGLIAMRWVTGVDRSKPALWGLLLMGLFFGAALAMTPSVPHHAKLQADTLLTFIYAAGMIAAWPCNIVLLPCMLLYLFVQWRLKRPLLPALSVPFAVYLPAARFIIRQWRKPPEIRDPSWFLFALCLWMGGQILAISYGRGTCPITWRYNDLFAIGVLLNFACLGLWQRQAAGKDGAPRRFYILWLLLVTLGIVSLTPLMVTKITMRAQTGLEQEKNIRAYLLSGNFSHLQNKPALAIPYPDADYLKSLLDQEIIRSILPIALNPAQTKQEPEVLRGTIRILMNFGLLIMALGALLYIPCVRRKKQG